jgi:predicted lipoprotein with Yx(FWY)xxD motif
MRTRTFAATALAVASFGLVAAGCSSSTTSGSSSGTTSTASAGSGGSGGGGLYGGGGSSASSAAPSAAGAGTQVSLHTTSLGTFLTDGQGKTLYLFEKDTGTTSTCTGACASAWPPFTTKGAPQAGSGVNSSMLGTTTRSDGSTEVTYHGHPLYYFAGDPGPGTTKGEGLKAFGAGWYVVNAAGNKIDNS